MKGVEKVTIVFLRKIFKVKTMVRVFRGKKCGFTLIEVLVAIALSGFVLTGAICVMTSYMNIWRDIPKKQREDDQMICLTRMVLNEISSAVRNMNQLKSCEQMTFKTLTFTPPQNSVTGTGGSTGDDLGQKQIPGNPNKDRIAFYWQSHNVLPFVKDNYGGVVEYFLKFVEGKGLYVLYRSLKPGDRPYDLQGQKGTGRHNAPLRYVRLLDQNQCMGLNFGFTEFEADSQEIKFSSTPKFHNGKDPDLPEMIQIILGQRYVI